MRHPHRLDEAYFRAAGINNGLTSAELGLSYLLPAGDRLFARLRDHALGPRRRRRRGGPHRPGLAVVEPERSSTPATQLAERIIGFSHVGVELTKQLLWASLDAGGLHAHMNHEGHAQLYVRLTTENFEEAVRARAEGRTPVFRDQRDHGHKLDPS